MQENAKAFAKFWYPCKMLRKVFIDLYFLTQLFSCFPPQEKEKDWNISITVQFVNTSPIYIKDSVIYRVFSVSRFSFKYLLKFLFNLGFVQLVIIQDSLSSPLLAYQYCHYRQTPLVHFTAPTVGFTHICQSGKYKANSSSDL